MGLTDRLQRRQQKNLDADLRNERMCQERKEKMEEMVDGFAALDSTALQRLAIEAVLKGDESGWSEPATANYTKASALANLAILAQLRESVPDQPALHTPGE